VSDAPETSSRSCDVPSVGSTRRQFVQRAALAGGLVAWTTPTVRAVSLATGAAGSPPPHSSTTTESTAPEATTTTQPRQGCTRTQGYWKNHADPGRHYDTTWDAVGGPDAEFFESGHTYLEILNSSPQDGNAFLILAHQWIAAELNLAAGASVPPAVQSAFDEAQSLLQSWSAAGEIPKSDPARSRAIELASTLDQYNNGKAGTPHCPG
jgi:hypothetical protein